MYTIQQIKNKSGEGRTLKLGINGLIVQSEYWNDETGSYQICNEIADFNATENDTIIATINSNGGDYFAGVAIHNTLKDSPAKVITKNMGLAASAASIIFMAGSERIVYPGTSTMTHDPSTFSWGNADDLRDAADMLDDICDAAKGVYTDAGVDPIKLIELMKSEKMMTPELAVEYGFATTFSKDLSVSNCVLSDREKQLAIDNSFGNKFKRIKEEPKEDSNEDSNINNTITKPIAFDAGKMITACTKAGLSDFIGAFHEKQFTEEQMNDNISNIKEIKSICAASNVDFDAVKDSIFNQVDFVRAIINDISANEDLIINQSDQSNQTELEIVVNNGCN